MKPEVQRIKEAVEEHFTLPYTPYDWQYETALECYNRRLSLNEAEVGYGKTCMGMVTALYSSLENGVEQILALMPPALITQFAEFAEGIKGIPSVAVYRGTPKERKKIDIETASVIIMSYDIFRRDYDRIYKMSLDSKLFILGDELSLKSMGKTYKKLKKLIYRKQRLDVFADEAFHMLCALNATPVSDQLQVYNWLAIMAPMIYPTQRIFKNLHVLHEDKFGRVTQWRDPELIADNFSTVRFKPPEGLVVLPECVPTTVNYEMAPAHLNLYKKVVRGEFDSLPPDKVELAVRSLFSTLQRLIFTPQEWGVNIRPIILDIIEGYLEQIGNEQVVIATRHRAVTKMLGEMIEGSVTYYGANTNQEKEDNKKAFINGDVQYLVGNLDSIGKGLNLQFCRRMLVVELPFRPDMWTQLIGRIWRQGQTQTTFINIPLAKGTVQQKIYRGLIDKDFDMRFLAKDRQRLKEFLEIV